MSAGRRLRAGPSFAAALVPLLLVASGCTTDPGAGAGDAAGASGPVPFADCAGLTAPPAASAVAAPQPSTGGAAPQPSTDVGTPGGGTPLPAVSLACFADGTVIDVAAVRGPAVINFWGSWCQPCREELPALQRLADRTAGQLHLIGVNTYDDRNPAVAVAEDLGLRFPSLVDRDRKLLLAVERVGLPLTLFVDADGEIRRTYEGTVDDATLADLVERELGLTVAR
ncbi:TlpA disulfide reductase family protein [Solwaraspora sp. WMMD792]|uniref:TlpA family protein disulfide reductase n=1 Tax=Solwaraspora sp. WMMD792 TaxID=3016099 RepID=UPI002417901C|nr:TlpA disulfide reductase family protein [Solwaraspora sp. WMMD792]MDG4773478.1 TlpA disulfide reductase family protein [Solwaraspora sp. WMMD792]